MLITYLWKKWKLSEYEEEWITFFGVFLMLLFISLVLLFAGYPESLPAWVTIVAGLILMELLFWLSPADKQKKGKKNKQNTFGKTVGLKLDCLCTVLFFFALLGGVRLIIKHIDEIIKGILDMLKWIGYTIGGIIVLIIILLILYLWIKLNERKFKK